MKLRLLTMPDDTLERFHAQGLQEAAIFRQSIEDLLPEQAGASDMVAVYGGWVEECENTGGESDQCEVDMSHYDHNHPMFKRSYMNSIEMQIIGTNKQHTKVHLP